MKRNLYGISIALLVQSFDHSFFTHLIPTTNRKMSIHTRSPLETGKLDSLDP